MNMSFFVRRWLFSAHLVCSLGLLLIYSGPIPAQDAEGQKQAPRPESPATDAVDDGRHANGSTDNDATDDMERRLGTRSVHLPGDPMKVIFIEGRYIDAPYHLMRRGLAIYVNGIEVERVEWLSKYYVAEETVRRALEWSMEHWQEFLDAPGLLYHAHGQLYGYPARSPTWSALPDIVAVLKSNRSPKEKAASLQPYFPDRSSDAERLQQFLKPLLTDFQGSPQLDARVELIRKGRRHAPKQN